jgi:hypothetical protein
MPDHPTAEAGTRTVKVQTCAHDPLQVGIECSGCVADKIQAAEQAAREPLEQECGSCGSTFLAVTLTDHICNGCGRMLCQSCVDVFDHIGNGEHGTGDPAEWSG